jgi:hypothetical protein
MAENSKAVQQSDKDRATVKMGEKMLQDAKRHRQKFDFDWIPNYEFFRGNQWEEKRPSYRSAEVLNVTWANIQSIIPILTDPRPNIEALPQEPSDFEFAEIMSQILRAKWDKEVWGQIVAEALVDSQIYGTAIAKVPWNSDKLDGIGDLGFELVDPMHFYPDPRARDINDDFGKYMCEAVPTDVEEVKRLYPKKAKLIESDVTDIQSLQDQRHNIHDRNPRETVEGRQTNVGGGYSKKEDFNNKVLLVTIWMHSDEMVEQEIEEKDKEGKSVTKFQSKKKYPRGRKIVYANNILLEDIENPYLDGKFPYSRLIDHTMPREFWGMGEIDQLKGPQRLINKISSYMMDILSLTGNPTWMVPLESGIDTQNLSNQPGLIVEHNGAAPPHRESGVMPSPVLQSMLNQFMEIYDKISGINDVSRGAIPSGMSGVAIDLAQEAAQTKLRLKSRNVDAFLTKAGQLMVSRILQFYQTTRVIRLTNNPNAPTFFKFAIDETFDESGESQQVATVQPIEVQPGQPPIAGPVDQLAIKSNLDLKITTGTELPLRKARKTQNAKELFQLGVIDEEELLEAMEWPNKEKTIEKFKGRKQEAQAAAQAEAQQAQEQALQLKAQPQAPAPGVA